jgi:3-oxoacyl-[acyl-carrier-protein] synthase III
MKIWRQAILLLKAAKKCLDKVGYTPEDVDTIIVATITPDMFFPVNSMCGSQKIRWEKRTLPRLIFQQHVVGLFMV